MPGRNDACPCGSTTKYKRCFLVRIDTLARELRDRDALVGRLFEWVKDEHEKALEDASGKTTLIRVLRGITGRNMSLIWALNDYVPSDGGPALVSRFAARGDLDPSAREIARGLAKARLDVYRVLGATDVAIELESMAGGTRVQLLDGGHRGDLGVGDVFVARIVHTTSTPTMWGLGARFDSDSERCWQERLATLPTDREQAALLLLAFHPDDAAEPLVEGLDLFSKTWPIDDDEMVLEALEEDALLKCIGETMPRGWAFSWLEDAECGSPDLGGWRDDDDIEVARLVGGEREMTLVSGDRELWRRTSNGRWTT